MHRTCYSGARLRGVFHFALYWNVCLEHIGAICHVPPGTGNSWSLDPFRRPPLLRPSSKANATLKGTSLPRALLNMSRVKERAEYFHVEASYFSFVFPFHFHYSKTITTGHALTFKIFIGKRFVFSEQMGQFEDKLLCMNKHTWCFPSKGAYFDISSGWFVWPITVAPGAGTINGPLIVTQCVNAVHYNCIMSEIIIYYWMAGTSFIIGCPVELVATQMNGAFMPLWL